MKRTITILLALAAVAATAVLGAYAGKPAPKPKGLHHLVTSAADVVVATPGVCTNGQSMQPDAATYVMVCFTGCTITPDVNVPVQPDQLWAVLKANTSSQIPIVQAQHGCAAWYYYT